MPSHPKPKTAHGQRLADFLPLLPAEEILREACRMGEVATIGTGQRPDADSSEIHIRAEVLRVFCLDRDPDAPVHEHGVQLAGAWIDGVLDLSGCTVSHSILLYRCQVVGEIRLYRATIISIDLSGSNIERLVADGIRCNDDMNLRNGFIARSEVRLLGANIGGNLNCSAGKFDAPDGNALNFDHARISGSVYLSNGFVAKNEVRFLGATLGGNLECSRGRLETLSGNALSFDGANIAGDVILNDGFVAKREVRLLGALIGGNMECSRGRFEASEGGALCFDGAKISGDVFLNDGFVSKSTVRLLGSTIRGILDCNHGSFEASESEALSFDRARISGSVFLGRGFVAKRKVRLLGAIIGGNLSCSHGRFEAPDGSALTFDGATISGSGFLNDGIVAKSNVRLVGATIHGDLACNSGEFISLSLDRAKVSGNLFLAPAFLVSEFVTLWNTEIGTLVDERDSWTKPTFVLDGLIWRYFGARSPTDATSRIHWLDQQPDIHLTTDFRPQPWEQCAKVLAEMGHERDATKIRIEKRKRMRLLDWRRSPSLWAKAKRVPSIVFDVVLWATVAYGYRPLLAGLWLLGLWMVAGVAFTSLVPPTVMTPTDARVYLASTIPDACRDDWVSFTPPPRPTDAPQRIRWSETFRLPIDDRGGWPVPASWRDICNRAMPSEYTTFSPWVYTLDLLLPIVDLRQEKDWAPRVTDANGDVLAPLWSGASIGLGHITRFGEWALILLGWVLSALLIGAVTGIIRRD